MSSGTDRARAAVAEADELEMDWNRDYYALLALAIKQHESLRGEHMGCVYNLPHHLRMVEQRDYEEMSLVCPECLVLLQWEQMWKEDQNED